jgi:hypothetical protein
VNTVFQPEEHCIFAFFPLEKGYKEDITPDLRGLDARLAEVAYLLPLKRDSVALPSVPEKLPAIDEANDIGLFWPHEIRNHVKNNRRSETRGRNRPFPQAPS